MKKLVPRLLLVGALLFALAIVWVNTGSHMEQGYEFCGGGGFMPNSTLYLNGSLSEPCLGLATSQRVGGRYSNAAYLTAWFATIGIGCLATCGLLAIRARAPRVYRNAYFRFVGMPIFLMAAGFWVNLLVMSQLAQLLDARWTQNSMASLTPGQSLIENILINLGYLPAAILLLYGIITVRWKKIVALTLMLVLVLLFIPLVLLFTSNLL